MSSMADLSSLLNLFRTWVLTFDSLGGGHPSVFKTLKQYLIREVKQKKSIDIGEKPDIREKKVPVSRFCFRTAVEFSMSY